MRAFRSPRIVGCFCALAAGVLLLAPAAWASDTFFLKNESKVATLTGTSLWGKGKTMDAGCRTGPFPGPTLTSFTLNPGDQGSITLSQAPFSDCLPGINPLVDNPLASPYITKGFWDWTPIDPFFGFATLHCDTHGQYGSVPIQSAVDGLTCTYSDPSPTSAGSFTSSAAPVRGGNAVAYLQHFPGSKAGAPKGEKGSRARYELILRNPKGGVHGRMKATIVSGKSRKVRVPITPALQEQVAEKGYVRVKAVLKRIDGEPGSGDRTVLAVMKDHKSLPF